MTSIICGTIQRQGQRIRAVRCYTHFEVYKYFAHICIDSLGPQKLNKEEFGHDYKYEQSCKNTW